MKKYYLLSFAVLLIARLSLQSMAQSPLFYGMTYSGGTNLDPGTIYTFNPSTNRDNVIWDLGNGSDGFAPKGNLIYDRTTRLFYGMTEGGGSYDRGSIISFNPSTNRDSLLWSLGSGTDGATPYASLVYYANTGLYYGLTPKGGTYDSGTIISFNPSTLIEDVAYTFGNGSDGQNPNRDQLTNSLTTIALNSLSEGIYHYRIMDNNQNPIKTGNLVIVR